ncbi:MAG TPA: PHB depolymerase family esterase [Thermoanaerobaculia bacterium]|jgi:polyhydroxybutyrate depolymerase|nr:PHB depolymerase family esterase [Thermoanaerobaculia bacterium]
MRRFLKIAFLSIALIVAVFAGLAFWALRSSLPPMPKLSGKIERGALEDGGRMRSWIAYLPAKPATHLALVIALHGSMGSAEQARAAYGYDFDLLADQQGFIAVYPQGYEGYWNDCRVRGPFTAKRENVDDVAFLHALVDRLVKDHDADRARVYVTGISNGGQMVLRLALQTPDFARAYAAVVASVPAPENMAVTPKNQPVSMLIMNGTGDPFNPWRGGDVVLHGVWGNRGPVLSTQASIDYFRKLAGFEGAPRVTRFPDRDSGDGSTAERSSWSAPGKRHVALYTIKGGGHNCPHPALRGPRLLGNSNRDIHAANEIWEFFQSVTI